MNVPEEGLACPAGRLPIVLILRKRDRLLVPLPISFLLVPEEGLEPSHPKGHMALNHACLPVSALGHIIVYCECSTNVGLKTFISKDI